MFRSVMRLTPFCMLPITSTHVERGPSKNKGFLFAEGHIVKVQVRKSVYHERTILSSYSSANISGKSAFFYGYF